MPPSAPWSSARLARSLAAGLAAGAATALVAEIVRPRGGQLSMLDWDEVGRLAQARVAGQPGLAEADRRRLEKRYAEMAAELVPPLLETVAGGSWRPPSEFRALDRPGWLELNVGILRRSLEPMLESALVPNSWLTQLGRSGLNRYLAVLLSFLSGRVLGQYDAQLLGREPLLEPAGLYLVEANITAWERGADLPGDDLRRWLILHELTHAWQFGAHPWLRDHMNGLLEQLVASVRGGATGDPLSRALAITVGLPTQWTVMRQMQAAMTLVEGHGNLVMNLAGRRLLDSHERLEKAYQDRSGRKNPLEVLFWRLTGLELKMQQYRRGEAFCRAVYEAHGMAAVNMAWEAPENLPRLDELGRPETWYRRVSGGGALRVAPA